MNAATRVHSIATRRVVIIMVMAAALATWSLHVDAHKPITSPFTFNEDVLPIVKARCAACHSPGGVAPMSLLTHADAVPWGESIRVELMAGHMPPWGMDVAAGTFRNVQAFPAREMNVLLTWASGGTPPGQMSAEPLAAASPEWGLGTPDVTVPLETVTLAEDTPTRIEEFRVPAPARPLRAVDLLPGTAAVVRRATVSVRAELESRPAPAGVAPERLLALWLPGDHPVALDPGVGFEIPAGAELIVRIYYRKTWQHERQAMTDRSTLGLYFADPDAAGVQVVRASSTAAGDAPAEFAATITEDMRAVAIYADPDLSGANVTAVAVRPDGSREKLISFHPRAEWARRYWFREPVSLPRGTRIQVTATFDGEALLPPAAARPQPVERSSLSLALNVVRPQSDRSRGRP